ncbi:P2Y purinoceptor 8 [Thalassophryne amazonica]|uniref:P2Y purinoceptor 8 n=1 Tax=Thalassophryne amazonica TaxID=390379 RepID=UPI0014716AF8|nr:P2Y purinoceptor 8 [Thalassophryne amazonica]
MTPFPHCCPDRFKLHFLNSQICLHLHLQLPRASLRACIVLAVTVVCQKDKQVLRGHSLPIMPWVTNSTILDNATLNLFQNVSTSVTISVIYIVIMTINLVGNGLSLFLLVFYTSPKTPSIIFMINLNLTDLAVGFALPFQVVYQLQRYNWTLGDKMCRFMTLMFFTNMYCSILTMTAIGVDRYLGIVKPMVFRRIRQRKVVAVFSCILMWVLVLSILYPLMTTDLTFIIPELGITTCFDVLKKDMLPSTLAWVAFLFTLVFILFLFPFCITTFCYVSVICKLSRDSKTEQKEKAKRLAVIVLLVFTICFAPNNILLLVHSVLRLFYNETIYMAYKLSLCFSCLNSCVDPFIYYFASKEFRQKLRQIMKLQTSSSSDSKLEHRESQRSTNCGYGDHEGEYSKMSLTQTHHHLR